MAGMIGRVPLHLGLGRFMEPTTRWLHARGRGVTRADAVTAGSALARRVEAWFGDADIVVSPTVGKLAPRIGSFGNLDGEGVFRAAAPLGAFTAPFNVSGQPAISLPLASAHGVPIGVQLVADMGREDLLLRVAAQLEEAVPWAERRPPTFAAA